VLPAVKLYRAQILLKAFVEITNRRGFAIRITFVIGGAILGHGSGGVVLSRAA
jgi:hypothetical protein